MKAMPAFPENAKYRANAGLIHPGEVVRVKWHEERWTARREPCSAVSRRRSSHIGRCPGYRRAIISDDMQRSRDP
jgi:hypothetical protein